MILKFAMTDFAISVSNIIHFLKNVQESCDKYCTSMEQSWNQEYKTYLKDWHQKQNELKKKAKEAEQKAKEEKSTIDDIVEEFDEFSLADSLLEKARKIRKQNEKLINGITDPRKASKNTCSAIRKETEAELSLKENTNIRKKLTKCNIPHSKSDFIAKSAKSKAFPRSKSTSLAPDVKAYPRSIKSKSIRSSSVSPCHVAQETCRTLNVGVISSTELTSFKKGSVIVTKEEDLKNNSSVQNADVNQHLVLDQPSRSKFISVKRDEFISSCVPFKFSLWYPFLSSSHSLLLSTPKSHQFSTHKKVFNLLNGIQETLMWLDLLWMVEKDVFPNLVYDEENVDSLRVCSYLLSIFHRYSQRIPILYPS